MACIADEEENKYVKNLIEGKQAWLGGTKLGDGSWHWTDGTEWKYENWRKGEPNNSRGNENSLVMYSAGLGQWNDESYAYKHRFVCQYF